MHKNYNAETEVNFFRGKQIEIVFSGLSLTRKKDVFHWFGCLLTRQAKSPTGQGTCQRIHISHEKVLGKVPLVGIGFLLHLLTKKRKKHENVKKCKSFHP